MKKLVTCCKDCPFAKLHSACVDGPESVTCKIMTVGSYPEKNESFMWGQKWNELPTKCPLRKEEVTVKLHELL